MARFPGFESYKRSRICAAICLMAAFLFVDASSVTSARLVKITVTGVVTSAVDETGVFGPAYSNLTGKKCTLVFIVDDMKGTKTIVTGNPPYASSVAATTGSNPMTATLTIGSGTVYYGVKNQCTSEFTRLPAVTPDEHLHRWRKLLGR